MKESGDFTVSDITKIDKNFKYDNSIELDDICFYNVKENPWCVFGLMWDERFRRIPKELAEKVNEGVIDLHSKTAGGRLRFKTDSEYVALYAVMPDETYVAHAASTGRSGFDMYEGGNFVKTFIPPEKLSEGFKGVHHFGDRKEREIMLHFPLFNHVMDLYIGLKKGSSFLAPSPYKNSQKIVYYGSSITQGGCVSRPSMAYPSQISLKLDCDFINLGFSGSAKGELIMAEYIAGLNPDIFVLDYDHNALTAEHLEKTHEKFFMKFRQLQPNTPVVILSAPDVRFHGQALEKRRDIVYRTYENAINSGDNNVYFIDGKTLWGEDEWRICSSDCIHPNDIGHYRMAENIIPVLKKIGGI